MSKKEQVKSIYHDLKGRLSVISEYDGSDEIKNESLWEDLNSAVDELNQLTDKSYDRSRIEVQRGWVGTHQNKNYYNYVPTLEYKTKLQALVSRLEGEFFTEEQKSKEVESSNTYHKRYWRMVIGGSWVWLKENYKFIIGTLISLGILMVGLISAGII